MVFHLGMRADCGELQKDHTRLMDLEAKWQMKFSIHNWTDAQKQERPKGRVTFIVSG